MQENLYKKIKNGIKKSVYKVAGIGIVSFVLATGVFAQEGTTIDNKINEEPNPTKISDEIKEEPEYPKEISDKIEKEPEYFKDISDKINESFQENLTNYIEIGGEPARKETMDGKEYCFLKNTGNLNENLKGLLDCALLAYVPKGKNLGHMSIISEAITKGFKEVLSPFSYTPAEMEFLRYLRGENGCAYLKTNIKDTKSPTQNKEE